MAAVKYEGGRNRRERQVRRLTWVDMYPSLPSPEGLQLSRQDYFRMLPDKARRILTLDAYRCPVRIRIFRIT